MSAYAHSLLKNFAWYIHHSPIFLKKEKSSYSWFATLNVFSSQQESTESSNTTIEDEDVKGMIKPEIENPNSATYTSEEKYLFQITSKFRN